MLWKTQWKIWVGPSGSPESTCNSLLATKYFQKFPVLGCTWVPNQLCYLQMGKAGKTRNIRGHKLRLESTSCLICWFLCTSKTNKMKKLGQRHLSKPWTTIAGGRQHTNYSSWLKTRVELHSLRCPGLNLCSEFRCFMLSENTLHSQCCAEHCKQKTFFPSTSCHGLCYKPMFFHGTPPHWVTYAHI